MNALHFCRRPPAGFTLIELITVVAIVAILVGIGVPSLSEFLADQRVRTAASDIMGDIAYARAKAVENSRRVYLQRTGATWSGGWRIFVDLNDNANNDGGEEQLKTFNGFPAGNLYACSQAADFSGTVVFRPDGRIVRNAAVAVNDGIYVIDTLGDNADGNNKIRGILFGASGRATVVKMNGAAPPCA